MSLACPQGQRIAVDNAFYGFWKGDNEACGFSSGDCKDFTAKPSEMFSSLEKMLALLFMIAKRIEGTAMNIVHYQFMHVEAALIWLTGGTWD